jgi:hypothetical protein
MLEFLTCSTAHEYVCSYPLLFQFIVDFHIVLFVCAQPVRQKLNDMIHLQGTIPLQLEKEVLYMITTK